MKCTHPDFTARVNVQRFTDKPDLFVAELVINCSACGRAMQFQGVDIGLSFEKPAANLDNCEARLPIKPYDRPVFVSEESQRLETN